MQGGEGVVRRPEPSVMAQRRRGGEQRREVDEQQRPEPVPFCRRCLHDFECMPDGR